MCVRSKKLFASRRIGAATRERPDECELALTPAYHPGLVPERPSDGRLSATGPKTATQPFVGSEQRALLKPVVFAGIGTYTSFAFGIGCDRMSPASSTAGIICGYYSFVRSFAGGVNDPELLCARGHRKLAFGEEVVTVAGIEPDFVVTPKVPERSHDRPGMLVDDNGVRVSIGRRLRYSLAGSDCSAPLPFLAAPHNRRRG